MYLEIDGKTYFIHIKTSIDGIKLNKIEQDVVHLHVSISTAHENLIYYIKNELPKILKAYKKNEVTIIKELFVFDNTYPVKVNGSLNAYLKNGIIYGNSNNFSTKRNIEVLKYNLLVNFINSKLSIIEEDLKLILPAINIKKLKTKYFIVCTSNKYITYSKILIDKSKDFITYVIIRTVGIFLKCSEEQIDDLLKKYVSNPKHCERVFKYEQ